LLLSLLLRFLPCVLWHPRFTLLTGDQRTYDDRTRHKGPQACFFYFLAFSAILVAFSCFFARKSARAFSFLGPGTISLIMGFLSGTDM